MESAFAWLNQFIETFQGVLCAYGRDSTNYTDAAERREGSHRPFHKNSNDLGAQSINRRGQKKCSRMVKTAPPHGESVAQKDGRRAHNRHFTVKAWPLKDYRFSSLSLPAGP